MTNPSHLDAPHAAPRCGTLRRVAPVVAVSVALSLVGCSEPHSPAPTTTAGTPATSALPPPPPPAPDASHRELASDPAQLADDLVADEHALRDPASPEAVLDAAAYRQQAAYRILGRHPEWDPIARPRIPPSLLTTYDRNIDARRELGALGEGAVARTTLPAWRIVAPAPADELLGYYRDAQEASGVDWAHLAAINLIETRFGRIAGVSSAGAQGPMQFLPSTFAAYGGGGDIHSPRDSIMAAGRFLAAHGFAQNRDNALYRYNNSYHYVRAVNDYAAVLAADPAAFTGYYRWGVYVTTTAGDVLLPIGYAETSPIPVADYLARQSESSPAVRISTGSDQILQRLLATRRAAEADPAALAEVLSGQFLGTPYGANTLVGSETVPEQLVVDLEKVDCFTYADYVEALKRAEDRDEFIKALIAVRYRDGVVEFSTRKHFFTDWAAAPAIATDITASLGANTIRVEKRLNERDSGGLYLPGLPVVSRTISYIPSQDVDGSVLSRLRTGDYIGAYAKDGGLDVTHVGIFVEGPDGPVLRNASSLSANDKVVDSPLRDYLTTVPGIVVLRPIR